MRYDATLREFVPYLGGISAIAVSFSPDTQSVAYVSYPENTLWRARADGSDKRQLTFAPLEVDSFSWSPDGRQIALRASEPGKHKKVYLMPADGGAPAPIVPADQEQGTPTWSPDGRVVIFGDVPA